MNFRKYTIAVILLIFQARSYSQFNNSTFETPHSINKADSNSLSLSVNNANYLKNNEYFSKTVQGYTLIGYFLQLRLAYQVTTNLKLEAGVHLQKYSGLDKFTQVLPVFTVNYQPFNWANIVVGTLYGTANHHMIDPIFDFERYYKNNVEDGVQLLIDHKRIRSDLWLSWEQFIAKQSTFQEKIVAGNSTEINILEPGKKFILSVPVEFLFAHKGGQDLNIPGHHIETLLNLGYGLHFGINFKNKVLNRLIFKGYIAHYKDLSPEKKLAYDNGIAYYPTLSLEAKYFDLMGAFWDGHDFIAPRGEAYYQSISADDSLYTEDNRRLVTLKVAAHYTIKKMVEIGARFEGYYDIHNTQFDFSYGMYLVFNQSFLLKQFGNKKNRKKSIEEEYKPRQR